MKDIFDCFIKSKRIVVVYPDNTRPEQVKGFADSEDYINIDGYIEEELCWGAIAKKRMVGVPFLSLLRAYTQLWRAIAFMHDNLYLHNDMHSMNVLWNKQPILSNEKLLRLKIIDFELVKHKDEYKTPTGEFDEKKYNEDRMVDNIYTAAACLFIESDEKIEWLQVLDEEMYKDEFLPKF